MFYALSVSLVALGLFLGMLLALEVGRHLGTQRRAKEPDGIASGAVDGAVFGLLGLLVAFSFSGALSRFDARRQLIVEEANAIGTAYLRLDLLPAHAQEALRDDFRRYVDGRLEVYRKLPDLAAARAELARSSELQGQIWRRAVAACEGAPQATMLLLPALNQMIDITTTRTMAAETHPPFVVFAMLWATALAASVLAGYGMSGAKLRNWVHILSFAAATSIAVYVILDLEYPRLGLIQVTGFDRVLGELRATMR